MKRSAEDILLMEPIDFILERFDGDYAILRRVDCDETTLVARALLPAEADEGDCLHWELLEYTLSSR